jgi:hypothetical protein
VLRCNSSLVTAWSATCGSAAKSSNGMIMY